MSSVYTQLEYVWLDGYETANLRSKTKVIKNWGGTPPDWNFDGSSTQQAEGKASECLLSPVKVYGPLNGATCTRYIVLCEVMNTDGTPHESNSRAKLRALLENTDSSTYWWGFEQEYFLTKEKVPLGFPVGGYPDPQGLYYCGVGGNQVKGRNLVEKHLNACLDLDIYLTGINAEVAVGQWEYQCFAEDTLTACDDLWASRYLLYKMAEDFGLDADLTPKPVRGDWNGSGCHTNFSNFKMRDVGGEDYFNRLLKSLETRHLDHIEEYGVGNESRLTGLHETQHISKFSWGVGDRGASIRVPNGTKDAMWSGYLEDRRPASNCDPYSVARLIIDATSSIT
jgi:glutamine synthetase